MRCDLGASADAIADSGFSSGGDMRHQVVGLMHAGGVLADATVSNQTAAGMRAVFAPKVTGMLNWQKASDCQAVASRVLFSSIAGLWGSPGQIQYSAANAMLGGLAERWQQQGAPAVSIDWGAWAGGGMAAQDPATVKRISRMGLGMVTPDLGTASLGLCLASLALPAQVAVTPVNWKRFLEANRALPMFDDIASVNMTTKAPLNDQDAPQQEQGSDVIAAALAMSDKDRQSFMEKQIMEVVQGIIGTEVDAEEPLAAAGVDSLGAVELRNSLESKLSMQLPATLLFDFPTVSDLSKYLWDAMEPAAPPVPAVQSSDIPPSPSAPTARSGPDRAAVAITSIAANLPFDATTGISRDGIRSIPDCRWAADQHMLEDAVTSGRFGGFLHDNVTRFDAACFKISGYEASLMDPQQRMMLQSAAECLMNSCRNDKTESLDYGVYLGIWLADYFMVINSSNVAAGPYSVTGITSSVAAGRLSYTFGFKVCHRRTSRH